jgi:hypothetical protein
MYADCGSGEDFVSYETGDTFTPDCEGAWNWATQSGFDHRRNPYANKGVTIGGVATFDLSNAESELPLKCAQSDREICAGSVSLYGSNETGAAAAASARPATRLGQSQFHVKASRTRRVRVHLSAAARRLLAGHKRKAALVRISYRDSDGRLHRLAKRVTLKRIG